MKLYTKEMFLKAAEECEVCMIDAEHIMKYIDDYVTPIELTTDEEIEEKIEESTCSLEYDTGFKWGAKWILEQIKQQAE